MSNLKLTKRALITSIISLMLCVAMLAGTTYAWFTSSVTSTGNIIQSGTLKVSLEYADEVPSGKDDSKWKDASQDAIFNYTKWEPGYTDVKYIKIENEGSLALQYILTIVPNEQGAEVDLAEVIDVYIFDGAVAVTRDMLATETPVGTVADLIATADGAASGILEATGTTYTTFTIVLKMQESAGNEYQGLNLGGGFSVNLLATQYVSEYDAFDNQYDADAKLPKVGSASVVVGTPDALGKYTIKVVNANTTSSSEVAYLATVVIPEQAVADDATNLNVIVKEKEAEPMSSFGINVAGKVESFDVKVEGLVEGNTEEIEVYLYVGKDKNVGKEVYHTLPDGSVEVLTGIYNEEDGYVKFSTTSFSPFSVVVYDQPFDTTSDIPTATVTKLENNTVEWDFVGAELALPGSSEPVIRLVDAGVLDVCYSFAADHTVEEAIANKYASWKCDYFVKVSNIETLPANGIILGGSYGGMDVAFTNLVEIEGDMWIPMLLTMSQKGWTYAEIVEGVGEFICGVKDGGSLAAQGVTFTVELRLVDPTIKDPSNPAEGEYKVVKSITYNFATGNSDGVLE